MPIEPEIIRELAHGGIKTLDTITTLLQLYEASPEGGLHDPQTRKDLAVSVRAFAQVISDLRICAICEKPPKDEWGEFDWKSLISERFSKRSAAKITFNAEEGDYAGWGHAGLLGSAIGCLLWFTQRFGDGIAQVHLRSNVLDGRPWICLTWDCGKTITVNSDFAAFHPFYPMYPKEAMTMVNSTGLLFCAIKRIAEVHGGTLSAQCTDGLSLEFLCPQKSREVF